MSTLAALVERWRRSTMGRAWSRYGRVQGNVLAGGIAYFAFFAFFPALALGLTVLGLVIGNRADLQQRVIDQVNSTFGGAVIIGSGSRPGLVSMHQLVRTDVLTVVGVVGLIGLLLTGLGWIAALRGGLGAIFAAAAPRPLLIAKLRDLAALVSLGLAALASLSVSVLVTDATGTVLGWFGARGSVLGGVVVNVLTAVLVLAIDTGLFLLLFRLLADVEVPWDDLFVGALAGGVALGLLKVAAGMLLRYASGNRFFAAFVIVAGLLLWMNLAARAVLLAAAWAATVADDRGHLAALPPPPALTPAPGLARRPASAGPAGVGLQPTYSPRAGDRTTILAGAVLGVTVAVAARVVARAGGTLREALRAPAPDDD